MTPVQRRVVVWLAALLCAVLTARLGVWQLSRADEKKQAHALMQAQLSQAPWGNADWPCDRGLDASRLPAYKPVVLEGQWLANRTVFLDNRPMDGMSGFVVVTPLLLDGGEGACRRRIVLVERGWLPRDVRDRTRLPEVPPGAAKVRVLGRVVHGLSRTYQLGSESAVASAPGPLLRQNADVAFWRNWLGQVPVAGAVLQVQAETPVEQRDVMHRNWPEPGLGQDKHLAYAAQWFALSALTIGLTVWFQIIRPRRARAHVPI
ncbi:MAG: SURF1 family protein [Aquabacterium sp.]|uniref:SURF1 family protein n=1 Tax=Aquabacterium sp. TaxID=1872578 RepID=UPI0025BC7BAA|nr:SURF1 family protein [Aquabacterium sp.]MBI5925238.1 SURF1 family protein [Aquabacterium sp.]